MGACFSKNTNATALTPTPQKFDLKSDPQQHQNTKNDQQVFKKEIFVIKHRVSHEIDRHSDQGNEKNPSATTGIEARVRTSSCSKEEVDAILIQCGRLSRSNSTGAQNPNCRRRYSRSKRSFDLNMNANDEDDNDVDDENDALKRHRHRQHEVRASSPSSRSSKERDSRQQRSSSKERRISISPSRRSESPFRTASGSSSNRPAKMISVPATDKSNNAGVQQVAVVGAVKRIHVKRNVSPARTNHLRVFTENQSQEQQESNTREADQMYYRRKSLVEINNNAARSAQPKRTRKLSRDLDMNPETISDPSPPSYASLLLEDIHNFHKKNTNATTATAPESFALPECVNKACLIMEAVADLNSNTSSSEDRWRNPTTIKKDILIESETVVNSLSAATAEQEKSQEPNSADLTTRECKFQQDYPRKGIRRGGHTSAYSILTSTTIDLT